ncbi:hypothetical protein [Undibacterium curvum]|uniref:hypothetical protein n=1 Tax=Undibacterium curvum TaxID=2762294 RepID=UPI003D10F351
MSLRSSLAIAAALLLLTTACDRLGLADPAKEAAQKESDAKATGSACRHAGRAIEDCYALNPDAARAAVYAGWKEMNDYMRENKIENVKPEIAPNEPPPPKAEHSEEESSASASASVSAKSKK